MGNALQLLNVYENNLPKPVGVFGNAWPVNEPQLIMLSLMVPLCLAQMPHWPRP